MLESFADGADGPSNNSEILHLAVHDGRLFAATGQWMSVNVDGAQILVKDADTTAWRVFERFYQVRIEALDSFTLPSASRGTTEVLVTVGRRNGLSGPRQVLWLRDGDDAFRAVDTPGGLDLGQVRSLGVHDTGGEHRLFVGSSEFGIVSFRWDPEEETFVANDDAPELVVDGSGTDVKVTGFDRCGDRLFVSINNEIFVREDDAAPEEDRWSLFFAAPEVGEANSGFRGLTCIDHDGHPAILASFEGVGTIGRFDDLYLGTPTIEVEPRELIGETLRGWGFQIPSSGDDSPNYVIAAYNEFLPLPDGRLIAGVEWSYMGGGCPAGRRCLPNRNFDAAACLLVRAPGGTSWSLECFGDELDGVHGAAIDAPVQEGEAFVAVRTMRISPFDADTLVLAGYDANFVDADETAWIATTPLECIGWVE